MRRLYTDVIIPMLEDFAFIFNPWLVHKWDPGFNFFPDWSVVEALQTNRQEAAEWLNKAWWISTQRKQEIMGEEIDEELDRYYMPMNLISTNYSDEIDTEEALKQYGMEKT
jgi:hypothetical protein